MTVWHFVDDDAGYLDWLKQHPFGFVVNLRRSFDPDYVVLHCASCVSIQRYPKMKSEPGGFTERGYTKLCGESLGSLEQELERFTTRPEPFSKRCSLCMPKSE
ncbi:hypothetical protein ACFOW6_15885 [Fodinicurvata halophila]|uniref:Uncharacterized protein n=1 Tax=Fodinicurvata halophila TaxID=1419723 RepID=A0ABV8UP30_9PROT